MSDESVGRVWRRKGKRNSRWIKFERPHFRSEECNESGRGCSCSSKSSQNKLREKEREKVREKERERKWEKRRERKWERLWEGWFGIWSLDKGGFPEWHLPSAETRVDQRREEPVIRKRRERERNEERERVEEERKREIGKETLRRLLKLMRSFLVSRFPSSKKVRSVKYTPT